ncbi:hypothetical protein DZE40_003017 [Clostridium beijerinckii]|nr:hypothetical protein [Clostridium beijerinckii]
MDEGIHRLSFNDGNEGRVLSDGCSIVSDWTF